MNRSHKHRKQRERKEPTSFLDLGQELHKKYFGETNVLSSFSDASKADELINKIEKLVSDEAEYLSASQLRNVYDKIISANDLMALKMIRPQLAYMAGRVSGKDVFKIKSFLSFIDYLIKETTEENLDTFKKFMEMIVAYHKYHSKTK